MEQRHWQWFSTLKFIIIQPFIHSGCGYTVLYEITMLKSMSKHNLKLESFFAQMDSKPTILICMGPHVIDNHENH